HTTRAGIAGGTSSQIASACSTAGGITSTTGRPRSSAARAALTSVTRTSVVKGRRCGSDGSFGAIEMQLRALLLFSFAAAPLASQRPRARDIGIVVGVLPPGPLNAITDVAGVRVGHTTIARGDSINTGVTAILPPGGNVFRDQVPAAGGGRVAGGAGGAGRGTGAFGWRGGTGPASRGPPAARGPWTVGALVQSNFGGLLTMNGAPGARELGRYYLRGGGGRGRGDG